MRKPQTRAGVKTLVTFVLLASILVSPLVASSPREQSSSAAAPPVPSAAPNYGATWTELGPRPIGSVASGVTYGAAPLSGRVRAVAINSSNPQEIYLGSAHGGVWKTKDGGTTWTPLTDNQASLATGAITISPDGRTVYVGTGEGAHTGDTYYGEGLLASTDGGKTWTTLGLGFFGNSSISGILVDPTDANRLLVSTTWAACCGRSLASSENPSGIGVYLSTDRGLSWSIVLQTPAGSPYNGFAQLLADPAVGSVVYAADFGGTVWRSTNFGSSWTRFAGYHAQALQGRVALSVSQAMQNTLYAAYSNSAGDLIGIFRYTVASTQNTTLTSPPGPPAYPSQTPCGGNCNYDLVLSVNPSNPSVIYFGARDLYVSKDSGQSWTDIGGLWYPQLSQLHSDQQALVFLPGGAGSFIVANDGGVWKSGDQGSTWVNLNGGLGTTELYSFAVSPSSASNPSIIVGTQDNGLVAYSNSLSWSDQITGDVGFTGFERTNPAIAYMYDDAQFYKSVDGGRTWTVSMTGISASDPNLFLPPLAQDSSKPGTLYLGATDLYKSADYGGTWTDVSGATGSSSRTTAIAVSQSNSSTIYMGDMTGAVRVSTDAGRSWRIVLPSASFSVASPVSSLAVDPMNPSTVYVSYASTLTPLLLKTSNQGVSWTRLSANGLPAAAIVDVQVSGGTIFVGTDNRAFYSIDDGVSWRQLGVGLPDVPVYDLVMESNLVYAATLGRGAWVVDVSPSAITTTTTSTTASSTAGSSTSTASSSSTSTSSSSTATASAGTTTSIISSQTTTQTSVPTTASSGGIPEFPYQSVAAIVFTVFVVTSYLLIRRRGPSKLQE